MLTSVPGQPQLPNQNPAQPAQDPATVVGNNNPLEHLDHVSFAPIGNGDIFSQCAARNINRKADKAFIPIIPNNDQTKADLELGKAQMVAHYGHEVTAAEATVATSKGLVATADQGLAKLTAIRQKWENNGVPAGAQCYQTLAQQEQIFTAERNSAADAVRTCTGYKEKNQTLVDAATNTQILPAGTKLSGLRDGATVILPGHGSANFPYLTSTQQHSANERISLKAVAQELRDGELGAAHKLKMPACHSADTEQRAHFVDVPPSSTSSLFEATKVAPAKMLANELHAAGVKNHSVFGYQGEGQTNAKLSNEHAQRIDGANGHVRASTVRREFRPDIPLSEKIETAIDGIKKLID